VKRRSYRFGQRDALVTHCSTLLRTVTGFSMVCACGVFAGCAASPGNSSNSLSCSTVVNVGPATAVADHTAASPGNQAQFTGTSGESCTNGVAPAVLARVYGTWTNPDTIDIQISSANDATNGTAICKGPTAGAVTLTDTIVQGSSTVAKQVSLTCQ
jgi:hypothetical protein